MRTDPHDRPAPPAQYARLHDLDERMSTSGYELSRAASPYGPGGLDEHDADEDPSQSAEGSLSPPPPGSRGGTAMYPPGPSSRVASESSASRSDVGHPSLRAHATHPHHRGHHQHQHQHHPTHPAAERTPIVSSSRLHEFLARQEDAGRDAARLQPAAGAGHAVPRPRKGKGKALVAEASSGSDAADSYEESAIPPRVHIVPVVDPDDSPYYPDSGATSDENLGVQKAPIRIRRVGALGISVSSDAGEELAANSDDSPPRWSADDDEHIATVPREGITDAHFRGIVDELSLQNQALKGRLRRYEAARVPAQLKKERLFEVRFFDGMPSEKREEIEGFLTRYVQGLTDLPTLAGSTPATPFPLTAPVKPTRESPRSTRRRHHHQSSILIPSHSDAPGNVSTPSSDEEKAWAGPSFSGVEPTSFTGTGTGMRISASGMERRQVATGGTSLETRGDHKNAFEIVDVLERFFEGALTQPTTDSSGTNEAYLSHLLDNASLAAGGWTYLNLVNTMSQVHRFNVTLPFIQTALRTYSTKLEVSADGAKVRWVGVKPVLLRRTSHGSAPSVHSNSDLNSATGSAETLTSSSGGVVVKSTSTAATSVQSKPTTATSHPSHRLRPVPVQPSLHPTSILGTVPSSVAPKVASYVPVFMGSQQDSDDSTPSSGSGSGSRNPYSVDGTGTMVFYSNGNFCSDLSTDVYGLAESADTVLALGEKRLLAIEVDDGPSVFTTGLTTIVESPSPSDWSDRDLEFVDGEEPAVDDGDDEFAMVEHPLLPISGMTEVVPADLFTINVQTARAPPRSSMKRSADSPIASSPRKRVRVIATSTEMHDSVIPPRRNSFGRMSRAASPDASSTAISQLRTNQPSPSPPDYLLSLSLPLYSWAPRETCLVLQKPGNSPEPSSASEDDTRSNAGLSYVT